MTDRTLISLDRGDAMRFHDQLCDEERGPEDNRIADQLRVAIDTDWDKLVEALGKAVHGYACGCEKPWPTNANYEQLGNAALTALESALQEGSG